MQHNIITSSQFWFPQQIIISQDLNFKNIKKKLVKFCKDQKLKDFVGRKLSNCNGWQSQDLYPTEDTLWVYEYLMSLTKPAIYNQLDLESDTNFSIENMWVNISKQYSYNDYHSHFNSDYSGCLYIQSKENSGSIQLNPNLNNNTDWMDFLTPEYKNKTKISPSAEFNPQEGMILLFPSYLMHKVNTNLVSDDRISIAFNIRFFKNS